MITKLLSMLLAVCVWAGSAPPSHAATFSVSEDDADRLVYIYGPIGGGGALKQAGQIDMLSHDSSRPIYLAINSPGGEVLLGLQIVSAMRVAKARGVKIKCLVGMIAASMASIIFDECSEKYALENSLLLWHSIAVNIGGGFFSSGVRLTPDAAHTLAVGMEMLSMDIPQQLQKNLGFDDKTWHYLYDGENFITAGWLHRNYNPHYVRIVDRVEGIGDLFTMRPPTKEAPATPDPEEKKKQAVNPPVEREFPEGPMWVPSTIEEAYDFESMDEEDAEQLRSFLKKHPTQYKTDACQKCHGSNVPGKGK